MSIPKPSAPWGIWRLKALCAQPGYKDLDWFPERTEQPEGRRELALYRKNLLRQRRKLAEVCKACPVQAECRAYAEKAKVTSGVWAGKNYSQSTAAR